MDTRTRPRRHRNRSRCRRPGATAVRLFPEHRIRPEPIRARRPPRPVHSTAHGRSRRATPGGAAVFRARRVVGWWPAPAYLVGFVMSSGGSPTRWPQWDHWRSWSPSPRCACSFERA